MEVKELVFVYGTLKRGFGNNRCLSDNNAVFIGEAISCESRFALEEAGIPFLIKVGAGGARVSGEIFECPPEAMKRCDQLEGHPRMYCRKQEEFVVNDQVVVAWVYLWPAAKGQRGHPVTPVDGVIAWDPQRDPQPRFRGEVEPDDGIEQDDEEDEEGVEVSANGQGQLMLRAFNSLEDATTFLNKDEFEAMVTEARKVMGW